MDTGHRLLHRTRMKVKALCVVYLMSALPLAGAAESPAISTAVTAHRHLADYDAELRLPMGRIDTAKMTQRLQELGVTTYYWLIAHAATDGCLAPVLAWKSAPLPVAATKPARMAKSFAAR